MVAKLIKAQFGIKLNLTSISRLLHQLGFTTYQKPLYRAYQRNADMVKQWKEHIYPQRAKKESAVIYFQDESGVRSDFHSGKTWALKGPTPVVESTGARFGLNMMAAIAPRGKMNFMLVSATAGRSDLRIY